MRTCVRLHAEPDLANCETCRQYYSNPAAKFAMDKLTAKVQASPRGPCLYLDEVALARPNECCPRKWPHRCELFGVCHRDDPFNVERRPSCSTCQHHVERHAPERQLPIKLRLVNRHCPGDAVVMSAAIHSLHALYPNRYVTDVVGPANDMWLAHPHVLNLAQAEEVIEVAMEYPLIHECNQRAVHFMDGYCHYLSWRLGVSLPNQTNRPRLYLSPEERTWMNQVQELTGHAGPYVIVNAGHKNDYTTKWWGTANFQACVNRLKDKVCLVQIGATDEAHHHPPLEGVLDLRGRTDTRQLMRLVHHSSGGLGPSTFLQHLCAALDKPYVLLAGGREPVSWQSYPKQITLSSIGRLRCCSGSACWRSRVVALDAKDTPDQLCAQPVSSGTNWVPQCLDMIRPEMVADAVWDMICAVG